MLARCAPDFDRPRASKRRRARIPHAASTQSPLGPEVDHKARRHVQRHGRRSSDGEDESSAVDPQTGEFCFKSAHLQCSGTATISSVQTTEALEKRCWVAARSNGRYTGCVTPQAHAHVITHDHIRTS